MENPNTPVRDPLLPPEAVSPEGVAAPVLPGAPPSADRAAWRDLLDDIWRAPFEAYETFRYKLDHLPQTNFALAQRLAAEGHLRDAVFRYRVTLWLAPKFQLAHYELGKCYLAQGNLAKAMAQFRKSYALNQNHDETNFMIDMIDPAVLPKAKKLLAMPRSIAAEYFDRMAEGYDASQLERRYRGHMLADQAIQSRLEPGRVDHHLLDLGCGTGLVGTLLSRVTARTVGVDLSRPMLSLAQQRRRGDDSRVYTETILQDMRHYLADTAERFEIIAAIHVFNYMGDVGSVFEHVGRALVENGLFVFQTEPYPGEGYGLIPKLGQYGHSEAWIEALLARSGLELLQKEKVDIYPDHPAWQWVATRRG